MRILLISNMWPGARKPHFGIFVRQRVDAYRAGGADVVVVANSDPRHGLWALWKYTVLLGRVLATAARRRPDVIEAHYLVPTALFGWIAGKLTHRPYALYAHGSDVDGRLPALDFVVDRAALILTNADATARKLEERFSSLPGIRVVPPGVDLSRFAQVQRAESEYPTVGFLGDLVQHKGVDVLLDAVAAMSPQPRLLVGGDGPERAALHRRAAERGVDAQWLGAVRPDQVPSFFSHIDVAAVPSRRDALGVVAVEALAAGVPVVVSRVGGLAGVPTPDCGVAVPPDDPEALRTSLRAWLDTRGDPQVIAAARRRAADFDAHVLASKAIGILTEIAGTRAR
ncbi:MAG: glycosyltransferase [Gammaproteobacteria bacterium]|nr:glycosyltransferase [Gammaproteobacteria bacterium]